MITVYRITSLSVMSYHIPIIHNKSPIPWWNPRITQQPGLTLLLGAAKARQGAAAYTVQLGLVTSRISARNAGRNERIYVDLLLYWDYHGMLLGFIDYGIIMKFYWDSLMYRL